MHCKKKKFFKWSSHLVCLATSCREVPFCRALWDKCSTAMPKLSFLKPLSSVSSVTSSSDITSFTKSHFACAIHTVIQRKQVELDWFMQGVDDFFYVTKSRQKGKFWDCSGIVNDKTVIQPSPWSSSIQIYLSKMQILQQQQIKSQDLAVRLHNLTWANRYSRDVISSRGAAPYSLPVWLA